MVSFLELIKLNEFLRFAQRFLNVVSFNRCLNEKLAVIDDPDKHLLNESQK